MPKNRFMYLDFDASKKEQQEVVLRLCKSNNFSYGDVWLYLRKTPPPGLPVALTHSIESRMEEFTKALSEWDVKGIIAVDGTVTENNPEGISKVVGFLIYQIHRDTKTELELMFMLVDGGYRKRGHATNMVRACESLHLYPKNSVGNSNLVKFFTARVEARDTVVEFFQKLGFSAHTIPAPNHFHKTMFKGGPKCTNFPEKPHHTPTHVSGELQALKEV
jgi:hypothetical protein